MNLFTPRLALEDLTSWKGEVTALPGPKEPGHCEQQRRALRAGGGLARALWHPPPGSPPLPQVGEPCWPWKEGAREGAGCVCSTPTPPGCGCSPRARLHPQKLLLSQGLPPQPRRRCCRRCDEKSTLLLPKSIGRPRGSPNWLPLSERLLQYEPNHSTPDWRRGHQSSARPSSASSLSRCASTWGCGSPRHERAAVPSPAAPAGRAAAGSWGLGVLRLRSFARTWCVFQQGNSRGLLLGWFWRCLGEHSGDAGGTAAQ